MAGNTEGGSGWIWVIAVLFGICMLLQLFGPGDSGPAQSPQTTNSAEHRYVQRRFEQEGYSKSDAQQATDAVIKFHNAQKNR
jgi:hypothetical protein